MYEVKVGDNLFIAHSLNNEFFGPAKNLHGATYVIDLILSSNELSSMNVVIDIGLASKLLKALFSLKYKFKFDILPSLFSRQHGWWTNICIFLLNIKDILFAK